MAIRPPYIAVSADDDPAHDNLPAFQAALAALPPRGGLILVPPGEFRLSGSLEITTRTILRGAGNCADYNDAPDSPTRLIFPSGTPGIIIRNSAGFSVIEDIGIRSANPGDPLKQGWPVFGSDDGIKIEGTEVRLSRVTVSRFGGHGVSMISRDIPGDPDPNKRRWTSNLSFLQNVRAVNNRRSGFYVDHQPDPSNPNPHNLPDSNVITFVACDATANGEWVYFDGAEHNLYLNPHANDNQLGDYRVEAGGGMLITPYSEIKPGGTINFGANPNAGNWILVQTTNGPRIIWNGNSAANNRVISPTPGS